ncbi:MAG: NAD(P)/FAD-dependent oxidoreductase [Rhodomicrobiaceae bacterium]
MRVTGESRSIELQSTSAVVTDAAPEAARGAQPVRIVICGGGAAGVVLASTLARQNRRGQKFAVSLVDPDASHVWKPLLHEFAAGSSETSLHKMDYIALARRHGFFFSQGSLKEIDRESKMVLLGEAHDETGVEIAPDGRRLPYDYLVVAVGGVTDDFGISGVQEHAWMLDSAADAQRIHRRILQYCMRANYTPDIQPRSHMDINIVGGGATGVELAAEMRDTTRELLSYGLNNIVPEDFIRLRIINADSRLLQQLPERIGNSVEAILRDLMVDVRNGEMVTEVAEDHVTTKSGVRFPSDLTIWAAGVKAPAWLSKIEGLETNKANQLVVTSTLQTTHDPAIFAIGDCASAPWIGTDKTVPPRAQAAFQQARYLARAIPAHLRGERVKPFQYSDFGSLISLGEDNAVGTLMGWVRGAGIRIEGFLAQSIYSWLYKRHQAALYGWWGVLLDSLGRWMRGATRPRVKLH